jgi:hypothetical protein
MQGARDVFAHGEGRDFDEVEDELTTLDVPGQVRQQAD